MSQPRVFSLQKLVEVADFNMDSRGRIVWANVWGVLSQHFSALGAHSNRSVRTEETKRPQISVMLSMDYDKNLVKDFELKCSLNTIPMTEHKRRLQLFILPRFCCALYCVLFTCTSTLSTAVSGGGKPFYFGA